jgi:hypothetical protein
LTIARESERRFRITLPDCETFIPELSVIFPPLEEYDEPQCEFEENAKFPPMSETSSNDEDGYEFNEREYDPYDSDNWDTPLPVDITVSPLCNDDESAIYNDGIEGDEDEELEYIPKKRGRKVNGNFVSKPLGALSHPYLGWTPIKAVMEEYMRNYAKQEGFVVIPAKERGGVI